MRRFIVVSNTASTEPFSLKDLPGSAGRMDVVVRCLNTAFFLSNDLRRDVEVLAVLLGPPDPPVTLRVVGAELKYMNPDERNIASLINHALMKGASEAERRSTPGIYISRRGFEDALSEEFILLDEDGEPWHGAPEVQTFLLGDQKGLNAEQMEYARERARRTVSLGPKHYHTDHCILITNYLLDRETLL